MGVSDVGPVVRQVSPSESVAEAVTEAITEALGADQTRYERLYDRIDPDVLDRIVNGRSDDNARVVFSCNGCEVIVRGDGTVIADHCDTPERSDGGFETPLSGDPFSPEV